MRSASTCRRSQRWAPRIRTSAICSSSRDVTRLASAISRTRRRQQSGRGAARLARALVEAGDAEWVYSAVIGMRTPHFHQHLLPRYPGTPDEVPWHSIDEWKGAKRGGAAEISELADRLKASRALAP